MEFISRSPNAWRVVNFGSSGFVFSDCWLLRVDVFDGVTGLHVLEQFDSNRRPNLGRTPWDVDVGDPDCGDPMRGLSSSALYIKYRSRIFPPSCHLVEGTPGDGARDHSIHFRRRFVFCVLPAALGSLGHVYADPVGGVGNYPRLLRHPPTIELSMACSGAQ